MLNGLEKYNIFSIKLQNQFQNCGINTYLAKYDQTLSEIPKLSGVLTNMGVQVAYYYIAGQPEEFKPAIILSGTEIYEKSTQGRWAEVATAV